MRSPEVPAFLDMLDRIPLDARVIMDVGCGSGELAAAFKRRNPAVRYLGVERDPDLARQAGSRMDMVACVDIEHNALPFVGETIDCIIYNDVLEHLRDPWTILQKQAIALRENGSVLLCIPNMEHWSFMDRLLRGSWDYEDAGLLDRDHLRWFNPVTTRRALLKAGLFPLEPLGRIFNLPLAEDFAHALSPALTTLGIDPTGYLSRSAPLQHIWRARKKQDATLHIVSTMLAPVGGVSHVRVTEPLRALSSSPAVTSQIAGPSLQPIDGDDPRIFIFHRPAFAGPDGLTPIRQAIAQGYVVVCEFDDHPGYIPILNRPDVYNFSAVHAVQTSTQELADVLRRDNPEVTVFPNAVSSLPDACNYRDPGRLTLFCAGLNREDDWIPIIPALNAVAALAGERLHFRVVNDRALFDTLRTQHKSFTPLCDYETYHDLLSTSEISCMPLLDNPFNRCKSDLKFIEAASHRVTALASPIAYGDSIVDGRTGVIFRNPQELQQKLLRIIADPDLGRAMANAARDYVSRHRMLAYQVARRTAWYRSLWARKDELTRALLLRVPEMLDSRAAAERGALDHPLRHVELS
jgi:SAM-dependent methyltransferase